MSLSYPDINLKYRVSSHTHTSFGEETIDNSIKRILTTRKFSRFFNRQFGSRIEELLFEPMSELTALAIRSEIFSVLEMFEPRIVLDYGKCSVVPDYVNDLYVVKVFYRIILTGTKSETLVFMSRNVAHGY